MGVAHPSLQAQERGFGRRFGELDICPQKRSQVVSGQALGAPEKPKEQNIATDQLTDG